MSHQFDTKWDAREFAKDTAELIALLRSEGLEVTADCAISKAYEEIQKLVGYLDGQNAPDLAVDQRPAWRQAIGLADLAKKIVAVRDHPSFPQLVPLFNLLLSKDEISLFTRTEKENDANNKLFELLIAASAMRFTTDCKIEDPQSGKPSNNPDFIGTWRGKRWGIACKALHSDHPQTTINHVIKGVDQIQKSGVDEGMVVINGKNLIPHDLVWPAWSFFGEWHYHAHPDPNWLREEFGADFRHIVARILLHASGVDDPPKTEEEMKSVVASGRKALLGLFAGKKAKPWMPMVWLTLMGQVDPHGNKVAPAIFRFFTTFEVSKDQPDPEAEDFGILLSLAIQNIDPSDENLALAKSCHASR